MTDLTKQTLVDALMTARCYITDAIYTEQQQMAGYEHLSDLPHGRYLYGATANGRV